MPLQGYTPADLARLRSVQTNQGHTTPMVRDRRVGLQVVRVVRRATDSGAIVTTREHYHHRGDHKDVHIQAPHIRGFGTIGRQA
ncbi:hypothetical protein [Streptosporangium minutum]|uniref:Uncharacterized protein n=1 Tax=Streptosporangium minutum TaxID=569862 RepID=A0A243RVX2_9ACTN|nr:hypothetical protein [Streptosporangium minutum]OUC99315.1 hypothetical protein CA984_03655 [Streptosporangium minutum]